MCLGAVAVTPPAGVRDVRGGVRRFGGPSARAAGDSREHRAEVLRELLPSLRGAVSAETPKLLCVDLSEPVLELVDSVAAPELTAVGAACPDHLVHTKRVPLWVAYVALGTRGKL